MMGVYESFPRGTEIRVLRGSNKRDRGRVIGYFATTSGEEALVYDERRTGETRRCAASSATTTTEYLAYLRALRRRRRFQRVKERTEPIPFAPDPDRTPQPVYGDRMGPMGRGAHCPSSGGSKGRQHGTRLRDRAITVTGYETITLEEYRRIQQRETAAEHG